MPVITLDYVTKGGAHAHIRMPSKDTSAKQIAAAGGNIQRDTHSPATTAEKEALLNAIREAVARGPITGLPGPIDASKAMREHFRQYPPVMTAAAVTEVQSEPNGREKVTVVDSAPARNDDIASSTISRSQGRQIIRD